MHKFCSSEQIYAITRIVPNTWFRIFGPNFTIISWIWPRIRKFSSSEQFYAVLRIVPNTWFPLSGTKFTIISWILPRIHKFCSPEQFYAQVLQFGTILCNSKNCSEHVISVIWDQIYHNILNFTKNSQVL